MPVQFVFLAFHRSSLCHNCVEFDKLVKMLADPLKRRESEHFTVIPFHCMCTACSTKVVHKGIKAYVTMPISIMSSKRWFCLNLIEVQGDSATRNKKEGMHMIALFPSTMLKYMYF